MSLPVRKHIRLLLAVVLIFIFSSCYSVRIVNRDGIFEPDPLNTSKNFYKGKMVHELDTVVSLKPLQGEFYLIEKCSGGCFYSVEYRVTFGGLLLSTVTLGKKRQVKIKYVCSKQSD